MKGRRRVTDTHCKRKARLSPPLFCKDWRNGESFSIWGHPPCMTTQVLAALQREQANALVLFLNYKKYHWLTFGPNFRDLHLLFEEHGNQTLASVDELAERALMIDGQPLSDPTK